MALVPFTGTTDITVFRSNMDDATATLRTNAATSKLESRSYEYMVGPVASLTSATLARDSSIAFTMPDDVKLIGWAAHGTADAISRTLTAALTVDNGDTTWLLGQTLLGSVTSTGAGLTDVRSFAPSSTITPTIRLVRGVRYRLTIACTTSGSFANAVGFVMLASTRKRA